MTNDDSRTPGPASPDPGPSPGIQKSEFRTHTIRLRGAWVVAPDGTRSRHSRRFGWPTSLDPQERVWLVCTSLPGPATVSVNGAPVGERSAGPGPLAADITSLLAPRNELVIAAPTDAPVGEVGLEVRREGSAPA